MNFGSIWVGLSIVISVDLLQFFPHNHLQSLLGVVWKKISSEWQLDGWKCLVGEKGLRKMDRLLQVNRKDPITQRISNTKNKPRCGWASTALDHIGFYLCSISVSQQQDSEATARTDSQKWDSWRLGKNCSFNSLLLLSSGDLLQPPQIPDHWWQEWNTMWSSYFPCFIVYCYYFFCLYKKQKWIVILDLDDP